MRVIAGSARGRNLKGPPRPRSSGRPGTRPTSDLIRGVIFDMLASMGASLERVLDLYAGTGALGIEALSRGEGRADFVEQDAELARVVRANLALCGFEARAQLHTMPAALATSRLREPYTLVLADPPYYDSDAVTTVEAVARSSLVAAGGVLVYEHHRRVGAPDELGALALYRRRRHGDTVVSIYEQQEGRA
ncbi:MAG: RsmD family RNA methyltransferase [Dehalococcoidia bacterium]|nr:RsmD family RNA methyltransferase [Dehalococcoidia bacterium]